MRSRADESRSPSPSAKVRLRRSADAHGKAKPSGAPVENVVLLSSEMVFYDDLEGVVVAQAHRRDSKITLPVDEDNDALHNVQAHRSLRLGESAFDDSTAAEKNCAEALERAAVAESKCGEALERAEAAERKYAEALERAEKAERQCAHLETEKVRTQSQIWAASSVSGLTRLSVLKTMIFAGEHCINSGR